MHPPHTIVLSKNPALTRTTSKDTVLTFRETAVVLLSHSGGTLYDVCYSRPFVIIIYVQPDSIFTCTICLDGVELPVVTQCGHLYCWPCLYQWLEPGMKPEERQTIVPQFDDDDEDDRPSPSSRRECPACKAPCSVTTVVPIYVGGKDETHDSNGPRPQSGMSSNTFSGRLRQVGTLPPRPTRVITELVMELTLASTHPSIQPITRSPTLNTSNTLPIPSTLSLSDISGASSMNRRASNVNTEFDQHEAVHALSTRLNPNAPSFGFSPESFAVNRTLATNTWRRPEDSLHPDVIGLSTAFGEIPQSYARETPYPSTHTFHPRGDAPPASDPSGATPPPTPNLFSPTTMDGTARDAGRAFDPDYVSNQHQPHSFHGGGGGVTAVSTPPRPPYYGGGASWQYHNDVPNMATTMPAPPNSAVFGNYMPTTHPTSGPAIRNPFWGAAASHASTPLDYTSSVDHWHAWHSGFTIEAQRASNGYGSAVNLQGLGWPRRFGGGDEDDGMIPQASSPAPFFGGPDATYGF